jgi:DNA-binding CsgD family transcriptional regulator
MSGFAMADTNRGLDRPAIGALDAQHAAAASRSAAAAVEERLAQSWVCLNRTSQLQRMTSSRLEASRMTLSRLASVLPGSRAPMRAASVPAEAQHRRLPGAQEPAASAPPVDRLAALSPRQREIVGWVERSATNKEIARQLGIEPATVKAHLRLILTKVGAQNRTVLALMAACKE